MASTVLLSLAYSVLSTHAGITVPPKYENMHCCVLFRQYTPFFFQIHVEMKKNAQS